MLISDGIVLREIYNVAPRIPFTFQHYKIPKSNPLVFDLFDTPREVDYIHNNTHGSYYVRLFTDEWYININPNATYNLELENDYMDQKATFSDINFIAVKSKMFTHGIARTTIVGLKYNK